MQTKLPSQVQKMADEAERLLQEANQGNTDVGGQQGISDGTPTDTTQTPGDSELQAPQHQSQQTTQAPDSQGIPFAAPENGDKGTPRNDGEDFRQKYFVLQGKYNSEVPRMRAQLDESNTRIKELESLVASLRNGGASGQQQGGTDALNFDSLEEDYGPEIAAMARQNAELVNQNKMLTERLDAVEGGIRQTSDQAATSAVQQFQSRLAGILPNWEAVDSDPAFDGWLHHKHLKTSLIEAAQAHDAQRVAEIMGDYLKEVGGHKDKEPVKPQPRQQTGTEFTPPPLNTQVAPDSKGGAQPDTKNAGRVYAIAEVNDFYKKSGLGRYPFQFGNTLVDSPEQMRAYDNDITLANAEGRIRG
jgi:hypothetical protein